VLAASIIRAISPARMMEAEAQLKPSVNFYQRLYGATTQKPAIFIVAAVRT
jgi:hypothetical protein